MDNFHNILHYLKLENINVDSKEFLFQVKSHPNFPSLLAVTDTLSFFNIENGVFDIQFDEIESLPNNFLVILKENRNDTHLYLVESKNGKFFIMRDGKSEFISKDKLKAKWNNFVLFVEKTDSNIVFKKNSNTLIWLLAFVFMLFFLMFFFFEKISFLSTLFLILPIFGMMFSIGAFKDILGSNNRVINAFCNISTSTSCTEIISSNKWKIFDIIKLSDLSMVFFCYQIVGYMNALFGTIGEFMYIQRILLLVVIPIIPISLYYQKKVEKKWCPICLGIIAIVILEIININTLFQIQNASIKTILISGFIFSGMSVLWLFIKTVFLKMKELKEFQYEGTRFMRNFEIFKTVLKAENSVRLPQSFIVLGQKNSNKILTIITNPFCSPCKEVHQMLVKILNKKINIRIDVIINTDIDVLPKEDRAFLRVLMIIFMQKGEMLYLKAMDDWYKMQSLDQWLKKYDIEYDDINFVDNIYRSHKKWCLDYNYNATPSIFINGYKYPKTYPRMNLQFFIDDIVDDKILEENIAYESEQSKLYSYE